MSSPGCACRRAAFVVVGAAMLVAVPVSTANVADVRSRNDVHAQTRANLAESARSAAFAHAMYRVYATQAAQEGLPHVRDVLNQAARTELHERFTGQAKLIGLVGDNVANLRDAMTRNSYLASLYRRFAAEAEHDGETNAVRVFTDQARNVAARHDTLTQALEAIVHPALGTATPAAVPVPPERTRTGGPAASAARTLGNLVAALMQEAFADAKYTLYAERARQTGEPRLAMLFGSMAGAERTEHFAAEARLAGLVHDTRANTCEAIGGELYNGRRMYPGYARQAARVGDHTVAALFTSIARDEMEQAQALTSAVSRLRTRCPASG
ncbi:ferritin family protein [Nonomuraea sp. NPDC051191]|uniref:ferritin family protein n=1 Tax=Nonomuraea sp. NPDC051191 TaxID=3364372 RepID=UPI0037912EAD